MPGEMVCFRHGCVPIHFHPCPQLLENDPHLSIVVDLFNFPALLSETHIKFLLTWGHFVQKSGATQGPGSFIFIGRPEGRLRR